MSTAPTSTDTPYTPHSSTDPFKDTGSRMTQRDADPGTHQQAAPDLRQHTGASAQDELQDSPLPGNSPTPGSEAFHEDDHWRFLETTWQQTLARLQANPQKTGSAAPLLVSSEPSTKQRNDHAGRPDPASLHQPESFRSQHGERTYVIAALPQSFTPLGTPSPDEWSPLHSLIACNKAGIADLLAAGGSIDAVSPFGFTLLQSSILQRNATLVRELLAAGANPLRSSQQGISPLRFALKNWPEIALTLAEALPKGASAHPDLTGQTEIHAAVNHPQVLKKLLRAGLRDSACYRGATALMRAATRGNLESVKYLLAHPPQGKSGLISYVNYKIPTAPDTNALNLACSENHGKVVQTLLQSGARPTSLFIAYVERVVQSRDLNLLEFLLKNRKDHIHDILPRHLVQTIKMGWSEGARVLAEHVDLTKKQQYQLLSAWRSKPRPDTLLAISAAVSPEYPSIIAIRRAPGFLVPPFKKKDPELLKSMLKFFESRKSFIPVLSYLVDALTSDKTLMKQPAYGKVLIDCVVRHLDVLHKDKQTIMKMLGLSEQLKDYTLITEIIDRNFSDKPSKRKKVSFDADGISDPLTIELLSSAKDRSAKNKLPGRLSSWVSSFTGKQASLEIDGAQLSNDLILALKSVDIAAALKKVFDDHPMSTVVREVLEPLLLRLVVQMQPDPATRSDAICRFLIGYCFSHIADESWLAKHPAFQLAQFAPQWKSLKGKIDASVASLDQAAAGILDTMSNEQLGQRLPGVVTAMVIDNAGSASLEDDLTAAFRNRLGLLDVVARQLARACVSAEAQWQAASASSTPAHANGKTDDHDALLSLIRQAYTEQKRLPEFPEFVAASLNIDADLIEDFNNLVWWQMDTVAKAFGIGEPAVGVSDESEFSDSIVEGSSGSWPDSSTDSA